MRRSSGRHAHPELEISRDSESRGQFRHGAGLRGLKHLPLPDIMAIRFVTPILIVIFAALILGERLRLIRFAAVAMGLVGVAVIIWPQQTFGGGPPLGVSFTLGSAACAAFAQIFIKSMAGTVKTAAIAFYFRQPRRRCLFLRTLSAESGPGEWSGFGCWARDCRAVWARFCLP